MNLDCGVLLVTLLSSTTVNGKVALSDTFLSAVVRLRALHPSSRELFNGLLQNMGASLAGEEKEAFYSLLLSDNEDPIVAKIALASLLQGEHPELYLGIARGMFEAGSEVMRGELATAVASHAPPAMAAQFLAAYANPGMLAQFTTLVQRADAVEAPVAE